MPSLITKGGTVVISAIVAVRELESNACACGRFKREKMSLCYKCYGQLPRELKRRLYDKVGAGYEEALEESLIYLELPLPTENAGHAAAVSRS